MRAFFLLISLTLYFDLGAAELVVVRNIEISGIKRTKDVVILREIPVETGMMIPKTDLGPIRDIIIQNLTNVGLFNFVNVEWKVVDTAFADLQVAVEERWYIWPNLIYSLAETNFNSWYVNKDFNRINYGVSLQDNNFRGSCEKLTFIVQNGWTRKIGLTYQIPAINRKRTIGGGFEIFYGNNREVNISSFDNLRVFLKQPTFIQEQFNADIKLQLRPQFYNTHRLVAGFQNVNLKDTVLENNPKYLKTSGNQSQLIYMSYGFRREKRDNKAYPLKGYVIDGNLSQYGIGIPHLKDVLLTTASTMFNMHYKLGGRWFFGHGIRAKSTLYGKPSYFFQRGLGYDNNYIRGYDLVVIDGQHFFLYKSNLKLQLIKKHTTDLRLNIPNKFEKFHYSIFLNLFADAGYVIDRINAASNPLANSWNYATGIGIDFPTYYDLVVRFECSVNKQGHFGYYINFRTPI